MIAWVWDRVSAMSSLDDVVIATDSDEVMQLCAELGAAVVMTDPAHPSGTDRVAEVARMPDYAGFDVIVNVQGDEPLLDDEHVEAAVGLVRDEGWEVGTCATPIRSVAEWRDPAAVKVVRGSDGAALYFSRAPIPATRDAEPTDEALAGQGLETATFLRHVGLYVYRRDALIRWVGLPPGQLEQLERLEQLRPLAAGMRIGVCLVDAAAPGVDTPEDAADMDALLRELTLHQS